MQPLWWVGGHIDQNDLRYWYWPSDICQTIQFHYLYNVGLHFAQNSSTVFLADENASQKSRPHMRHELNKLKDAMRMCSFFVKKDFITRDRLISSCMTFFRDDFGLRRPMGRWGLEASLCMRRVSSEWTIFTETRILILVNYLSD